MSQTPRTDTLMQEKFRELGSLGPHNCPEWLVVHARQLERELTAQLAKVTAKDVALKQCETFLQRDDVPDAAYTKLTVESALSTDAGSALRKEVEKAWREGRLNSFCTWENSRARRVAEGEE